MGLGKCLGRSSLAGEREGGEGGGRGVKASAQSEA